ATPLKWDEEWARVEPVLRGLSPQLKGSVPISIDTYHPETAERAIALGASIVNCVFKEPIRDMAAICVKNNAELVIPCRIADLPLGSVPMDAGRLYLDPMIGFGTTREEDLEILRSISELAKRGRVLVGASRKRIVKRLTGEKAHGKDLAGNLAIAVWAAISGASVVRVHDVRETVQALKVTAALTGADEAN
ncbi:MAG: dihydropteroate synthase, partial [Kiritimatiellae bacterium]|nr:dihydropteroate synthase [Kiritimatiellia bacterium]